MIDGHPFWIDLLNAQETWVTDESMLSIVPEGAREFESAADWPKSRALAYLNNNANALRANWARLEAGQVMDLDLVNVVLAGVSLRLVDWRRRPEWRDLAVERWRRGERLLYLQPHAAADGWNRGTSHIRLVVQRAVFHFACYADHRLADPAYPGATSGIFRVMKCSAPQCATLVPCPAGLPGFCSEPCSEDTGKLK